MTLLLDTHTLLWFVEDAAALSRRARAVIEDLDNTPAYSIASVWEMAIKVGVGKLAMSRPLYRNSPGCCRSAASNNCRSRTAMRARSPGCRGIIATR